MDRATWKYRSNSIRNTTCLYHSVERNFLQLIHIQRVHNVAGCILLGQFIHTTVVAIFSQATSEIWTLYFQLWASFWPTYYITAAINYAWKFRRTKWHCDHAATDNDDDTTHNNVFLFPSAKFSDN
jgi:hypothetical protein